MVSFLMSGVAYGEHGVCTVARCIQCECDICFRLHACCTTYALFSLVALHLRVDQLLHLLEQEKLP
jgi:hypothetical protein